MFFLRAVEGPISEALQRRLQEAFAYLNKIAQDPRWRAKFEAELDWDKTDLTSEEIWNRIFEVDHHIRVRGYHSAPWSGVKGWTTNRSDIVRINLIWEWPVESLAGFLLHEISHTVGMTHGSNNPVGKEDTVPYRLGLWAKLFVMKYYQGKKFYMKRHCFRVWYKLWIGRRCYRRKTIIEI